MVLAHDTTQGLRTSDIQISQDVTFETMLLSTKTLQGLQSGGFYRPSPVQLHGIPLGKCGFDILLEAKSGTGKTAVFSVIALEKIDLNKGLQVIILAPTREIAAQICDVMKVIGSGYTGLNVEVVMGGLPVHEDIEKFSGKKNVHILVGSPGRLRQLVENGHINTTAVRLLVLDEADKLVEKSFQADINYIFSGLPKQKQVIMSSATYPEQTKALISKYVQNSQHVCPDSSNVLLGIVQKYTDVSYSSNVVIQTKQKYKELLKILSNKQFKQCLIFCNYQARVAKLHNMLTNDNWPSEQLYGQQEQTDRLDALKTLQEFKCRILIATDLAARGIDASNVDLVINFEPACDWQSYLHRIGRAGRYGSHGLAVTILSAGAEKEKFINNMNPIKDSLKITNLWDDSNIVSDNLTKTIPAIQQDHGFKANKSSESSTAKQQSPDPWKEMTATCNGVKEIKSVEDLNNLEPQNSSSTNIESFSELLQSFENHSVNVESQDISYANIKVNETSGGELSSSHLQCKINETYILNSSGSSRNLIEDLPIRNGHNIDQISDLDSVSADDSNIAIRECIVKDCKAKNGPTGSSMNNVNIDIKADDHSGGNLEANNYYSDNAGSTINTEMSLLGLPTAFASSRDLRNKNTSMHCKTEFKEENSDASFSLDRNNDSQNYTEEDKMNPSKRCKTKKLLNKKIYPPLCVEDVPSSNKSKCVVNTISKNHSTGVSSQKNFYEYTIRSKVYTRKSTSVVDDSESSSSANEDCPTSYSVNYINWYKQLKMRTHQLEMAFYIEEMSKM